MEDSHFESKRQDVRRWLKWNAVPTLFDVPIEPPVSSEVVVASKKPDCIVGFQHSSSRYEIDHEEPSASNVFGVTYCIMSRPHIRQVWKQMVSFCFFLHSPGNVAVTLSEKVF